MSTSPNPFDDLAQLQFSGPQPLPTTRRQRPGSQRRTFLKGPVPWPWLALAATLPGRSLHVGLALWFQAGLERKREVRLPLSVLAVMGVDRYAAGRGLTALEAAGLIAVQRHPGRKPRVAILAPATGNGAHPSAIRGPPSIMPDKRELPGRPTLDLL